MYCTYFSYYSITNLTTANHKKVVILYEFSKATKACIQVLRIYLYIQEAVKFTFSTLSLHV